MTELGYAVQRQGGDAVHGHRPATAMKQRIDGKHVLGTLCLRGHEHESTGKTLRYRKGGYCVSCTRERDALRKDGKKPEPVLRRVYSRVPQRAGKAKRGQPHPLAAVPSLPTIAPEAAVPRPRLADSLLALLTETCGAMTLTELASRLSLTPMQAMGSLLRGADELEIEQGALPLAHVIETSAPLAVVPTPQAEDTIHVAPAPVRKGKRRKGGDPDGSPTGSGPVDPGPASSPPSAPPSSAQQTARRNRALARPIAGESKCRTALSVYFEELGRNPPFTLAEERVALQELAEVRASLGAAHPRYVALRDAFAARNLRLVVEGAKRFSNALEFEERIGWGNFGLLTAIDRFDTRHGVRFSTYAIPWIRHCIMRALHDHSREVRIPANKHHQMTKIWRARLKVRNQYNRDATMAELVAATEISAETIAELETVFAQRLVELPTEDAFVPRPGALSAARERGLHEDFMFDGAEIDEAFDRNDELSDLRLVLGQLDAIDRSILERRFGIGGEKATLERIGKEHGLSRERIRQLETRALARARQIMAKCRAQRQHVAQGAS